MAVTNGNIGNVLQVDNILSVFLVAEIKFNLKLDVSSTGLRLYGGKYRNWVFKEHTYLMKKPMHIFINFCHCHISHVSTLHLFLKDLKQKL